jgi:hypothetical protein
MHALMTTHFKLAEHAQWVHDNVIFRSVYDGQLRLCMSLLCGTDEDPGLRIESFAVINLGGVSTNKTIICFIAMQTYKELITDLCGECIHSAFKRLDRLTNQRSRLVNNLAFLKRCRDNKVVPKGLRISTKYHTKYARKIMMKAELALVRERIAWTRRQLCRVDERISSLNEELWMTLNEEHYATAKRMISASSTLRKLSTKHVPLRLPNSQN